MAQELAKLGVEVWVAGYGKKGPQHFVQNGVNVVWINLPSVLRRSVTIRGYRYSVASLLQRHIFSLRLNRLIREQGIELVESHDFSGPLALKPAAKLIVRLHGSVFAYRLGEGRPTMIEPVDRFFEKKQLHMADHLISVSRFIGELTAQALGCALDYEVLYNAVDASVFSPQPIPTDGSLLFVGNVIWRKGLFDLIRALPLVLERHPSTWLKVAGGVGGIHQEHLKDALAELPENARARVELLGRVPHENLPALYSRASVFVFPSRVEAFGLTCAEAMASGRPVVATNQASGPELVEDGVSGLLADSANPVELAEKINILLDDRDLAKKLGANARQRVLERFDSRELGGRNLGFFHSIL
jgi:glycosyltransferase involved in cell wall biosynthesis